jgi:hypothetical protein
MAKKKELIPIEWKKQHKEEVVAVKQLGEKIGYGNIMSIASALWQLDLEKKHGLDSGAFIPTIIQLMKPAEGKKAQAEQKRRMKQIQTLLNEL